MALDLSLHPKQHEVFSHNARFKVVVAGRRWGKTRLSLVALIDNAVSKGGGKLVWYIAPSYRMAKQIMWDEIKKAIPKSWIKKTNETFMRIELRNNSVIELKGADSPDSLRGVGLDYVVLDEFQDMRSEVWTTIIRPTLVTTGGEALFIGTSKGYNHLYELWVRGDGSRKSWKSWQFVTASSPFVPDEELEQAKKDMDPKTFRQEFLASFEQMSGRIYYPFDRRIHVGNYPFNPNLPIYIGQDFNIDPMSSAICQKQPDGRVWAVDEIVLRSSNTLETCEEIERRYWRYMNNVVIYPDPASNSKQHARGETDLDIFREKGFKKIKYRRKHPALADRFNSVNKMLMDANGVTKLFVNSKCTNLIDSLEKTSYKEGGREIDKKMDVEHITDALGYFLEYEYPARKIELIGVSR